MREPWSNRNPIVANLLNPAFCGEVIRRTAKSFNEHTDKHFPFALAFLVLPILLHMETRQRMPRTTASYLFTWVEENDDLFFNFAKRARDMTPYTKESLMFLLQNKLIVLDEAGGISVPPRKEKKLKNEDTAEFDVIMSKAKMLGKWFSFNSNVNSVYSFFRITP